MVDLKKRIVVALAIMAVAIATVAFDAFCIEPYRLQVEEVEVAFADLPPALEGLRIAQISDTHIKKVRAYEHRVQGLLGQLQPDLLVVTGDLIEHAAAYDVWAKRVEQVGAFLRAISPAPYGTWATRGNTDISRYGGHSDLLVRQIRQGPVKLLINEHVKLDIRGGSLYLLGVDYAHLRKRFSADYVIRYEEGNKTLAACPCEGNAFAHYLPGAWPKEGGYEYSGRLRYTDPAGGIGITFGSRYPLGEDHFYRLRRYDKEPEWRLSTKGARLFSGSASSGIEPVPNRWYRFRVRWEVAGRRARNWIAWPTMTRWSRAHHWGPSGFGAWALAGSMPTN